MITQAIILAAGMGQRLNGHEVPKPLNLVGGKRLLQRTLDNLSENGVKDVGIVIGYRGDEIRGLFGDHNGDQRLTWIENPEYTKPNGVSVLAARWFLKGRAFLLMSDHIFCPDVLTPLARLDAKGEGVVLVVDSDIGRCYDLDDATKVRRQGDLIVDIGKQIETYDALDTGLFVISPALVSELAKLEAPSLSDGVRAMARRGLVRGHDIAGKIWQDVDTPECKQHAEWLLRAYGQDLRGPLPVDSAATVTLRLASTAAAAACVAELRVHGIDARVATAQDGGHCVRVAAPGGVADATLLEHIARAAVVPGFEMRPPRVAGLAH